MKRMSAFFLVMMLMLTGIPAYASTDGRVTESRISTRSGPGTAYTEPGSFLSYGDHVVVHTKVWDSRNEIYWVQVEFTERGESYRAYTGAWRLDTDLNLVPYEIVEGYTSLNRSLTGYAGPGYAYHQYAGVKLHRNASCTIIEVENNFALIETSGSSHGLTRAWVPLDALRNGYEYYGRDTFTGWYDEWDSDQGATLLPGGDYNGGWQEPDRFDPVGQTVVVNVGSGNARSGPGTNYDIVAYVFRDDVLRVLGWETGNTGKDWYQVRIDGRLCWVSSTLVTIQGFAGGTANGVPIVSDNPLPEYPRTSTYLIGRMFRVGSESARVRMEPSTESPAVEYVLRGQCYEILDCRLGNTGRDWYLIRVNGQEGWLSSGLVTLLD